VDKGIIALNQVIAKKQVTSRFKIQSHKILAQMTKSQFPMTKRQPIGHWGLGLNWSLGIGHWDFKILITKNPVKLDEVFKNFIILL